jgi:hypothetical protein
VFKAAALVLMSRVTANDYDANRARAQELNDEAERKYAQLIDVQLPPDTKWVVAK